MHWLQESQIQERGGQGVKSSKNKALSPGKKPFSSVHLHFCLCPRINSYGEVKPDIDNGKEEEEEEGRDEEERLGEHGAVGVAEL